MARKSTGPVVPKSLIHFLRQILFLVPLFWFVELIQNCFYRLVTGRWGWTYPMNGDLPYYLASLVLWFIAVSTLALLYHFVFIPKKLVLWQKMLIIGVLGSFSEWFLGYIAANLFGYPLQVWTQSPLVYIHYSAFLFWCSNQIIYEYVSELLFKDTLSRK